MKRNHKLIVISFIVLVFWAIAIINAYFMDESSEDFWQNIGLEWVYALTPVLLVPFSVIGIILSIQHLRSNKYSPTVVFDVVFIILLSPSYFAWLFVTLIMLLFGIKPFNYINY